MKKQVKLVAYVIVICLMVSMLPHNIASAKRIKLSSKSIALYIGQTKKLKLKGTTKKPKWSSSKKSVATVSQKGKIKAKKQGSAVIAAKLGKKKYKCKVKVKAYPNSSIPTKEEFPSNPNTTAMPTPTAVPTSIPTTVPTSIPTAVPTSMSTTVPTTPTAVPTSPSTSIPTTVPTSMSTTVPTTTPTAVSTSIPTAVPTSPSTSIPTKAPTTDSTVEKNYQKLGEYIVENGKYDSDSEYYYINDLIEDTSSLYSSCQYNADGSYEFSAMFMDDNSTDLVTVTITPPDYTKGAVANIFVQSSDTSNAMFAHGQVVLSTLTKTDHNITYTDTNAPTEDVKDSLYELGERVLGLGLMRWNEMIKNTGLGLSLKDLGFTSYGEGSVTTPTVADNYQKLQEYIVANGEYNAEKGYYYIHDLIGTTESLYTVCRYNLDGSYGFSEMIMTDNGNDLVTVTITPPDYEKGEVVNVFVQSSDTSDSLYAVGEVVLSSLTETNHNITYTTTNAPTESVKDNLYKLGETVLALGLQRWSEMIADTGLGLSLNDLGFTSY